MAEKNATVESIVHEDDLAKSIELLEQLLDEDEGEDLEKAVMGTMGALQAETPKDVPMDPELVDEEKEEEQDLAESGEGANNGVLTEPIVAGLASNERSGMAKGEGEDDFAKSLAAAFSGEALVDVAKGSEFAKALVMASIESQNILHEEIAKSLSSYASAQDEKIEALSKSLVLIAKAVTKMVREVEGVSNAPVRRTPKSAQYLTKSFGGDTGPAPTPLSKAQVAERLEQRVLAGKLNPLVLSKYESAGEIDPALLAEIQRGSAG